MQARPVHRASLLALAFLVAASASLGACADDETGSSTSSSSSGTTSSSSSGGGSGTTTSTTTTTTSSSSGGGNGGGGGAPEPIEGAPGADLVNAGTVMNSPNHRLVFTLGQSSILQGKGQSPSYQARGGLTGATE